MGGLKTTDEQFASLELVAKEAAKHVVNCVSRARLGDVVTLVAHDVPNPYEIIAASPNDLYDIWRNNHIIETDVPLERAVEVVVKDYKDHKINIIMTRLIGPLWKKGRKNKVIKEALRMVTATVYDDEKQREANAKVLGRNLQ